MSRVSLEGNAEVAVSDGTVGAIADCSVDARFIAWVGYHKRRWLPHVRPGWSGGVDPCKTAFVAADSQPLVVVGFSLRGLWWVFCPEVGGACSMPRGGTQLPC